MSYRIDEIARTLASPMPRRKMWRTLGRICGGAAFGVFFAETARAATLKCGINSSVSASIAGTGGTSVTCCTGCPSNGCSAGACLGTGPGTTLQHNFDLATPCPSACSTRTDSGMSCTGGTATCAPCNPGCFSDFPCMVTATSVTCACPTNTFACGTNCCNSTTGSSGQCCCASGTCSSTASNSEKGGKTCTHGC
jgi:hypothetical protein